MWILAIWKRKKMISILLGITVYDRTSEHLQTDTLHKTATTATTGGPRWGLGHCSNKVLSQPLQLLFFCLWWGCLWQGWHCESLCSENFQSTFSGSITLKNLLIAQIQQLRMRKPLKMSGKSEKKNSTEELKRRNPDFYEKISLFYLSARYLIFVVSAATGVCVNFFAWCKFPGLNAKNLQIYYFFPVYTIVLLILV